VGSWGSLGDLLASMGEEDSNGNVVVGQHIAIDTENSLVFGDERLVATIGLENMVIVDSGDAVLICPAGREQEVRDLVRLLQRREMNQYL